LGYEPVKIFTPLVALITLEHCKNLTTGFLRKESVLIIFLGCVGRKALSTQYAMPEKGGGLGQI